MILYKFILLVNIILYFNKNSDEYILDFLGFVIDF